MKLISIKPPKSSSLSLSSILIVRAKEEKAKVKMVDTTEYDPNWKVLKESEEERDFFLALFRDKREAAESWFHKVIDVVIEAEEQVFRSDQPWGLIHFDIRSDNLRIRNGKLVLFDWPLLCYGPLILDVTLFFPSVFGEGGPSAKVLLSEYEGILRSAGITFPKFCIPAAASFTAGFFAARAGKESISLLPRLRENQRMQLGPALEWMVTCMNLPKPPCTKF